MSLARSPIRNLLFPFRSCIFFWAALSSEVTSPPASRGMYEYERPLDPNVQNKKIQLSPTWIAGTRPRIGSPLLRRTLFRWTETLCLSACICCFYPVPYLFQFFLFEHLSLQEAEANNGGFAGRVQLPCGLLLSIYVCCYFRACVETLRHSPALVFLAKPKFRRERRNISSYQLYALFMSAISFIIEARSENVSKKEVFHKSERNLLTSRLSFLRLVYLRPDSSAQECSISDLLRTAGFGHTSSLRKRMKINRVNVT